MNIAEPLTVLKSELLQKIVPEIVDLLVSALHEGTAVHKVEEGLWDLLLRTGHQAMQALFDSHGTGDLGATLTLPNGAAVDRLEKLHTRQYVSIFGRFDLERVAYGTREGQALAFVPLDNRLQLPEVAFSYLLQDWDQELAVEQAFSKVNQTIARMLRLKQQTDSLENMNRHMAADTAAFRDAQPIARRGRGGQDLGDDSRLQGRGDPRAGNAHRVWWRASRRGPARTRNAWPQSEPCIRSLPTWARRTRWWLHCSVMPTIRRRPGRIRVTSTFGPSCRKVQKKAAQRHRPGLMIGS